MFLGLDIGTSSIKAILTDSEGQNIEATVSKYDTYRTSYGGVEQNPYDWVEASRLALLEIRQSKPLKFSSVSCITLTGQMHSCVPLNDQLKPQRNAIIWSDQRSGSESKWLENKIENLEGRFGARAATGLTASSFLWLNKHDPEMLKSMKTFLFAKDYVRLWLTGEVKTDFSDAAGSLLFDQKSQDWSRELLNFCGVSSSKAPSVVSGDSIVGTVRSSISSELGFSKPPKVIAGASDCSATLLSAGLNQTDYDVISIGTSMQWLRAAETYEPPEGTGTHSFSHTFYGRWYRMAAMLNGTNCLNWLSEIIGLDAVKSARASLSRDRKYDLGLSFVPYLSGERTPHYESRSMGTFFGISPSTTTADLLQAVMEGISFSLRLGRDSLDRQESMLNNAFACGGGTQDNLLMQFIADSLGIDIIVPQMQQHAAILGAVSLCQKPDEKYSNSAPSNTFVKRYDEMSDSLQYRYEKWRRLYKAISKI